MSCIPSLIQPDCIATFCPKGKKSLGNCLCSILVHGISTSRKWNINYVIIFMKLMWHAGQYIFSAFLILNTCIAL